MILRPTSFVFLWQRLFNLVRVIGMQMIKNIAVAAFLLIVITLSGCQQHELPKHTDAINEMVFVESGAYQMALDTAMDVSPNKRQFHSETVSSFFIDKYEVTNEKWNEVRTWAEFHGYMDLAFGQNGYDFRGPFYDIETTAWSEVGPWGMKQSFDTLYEDEWQFGEPRICRDEISAFEYLANNGRLKHKTISPDYNRRGFKSQGANNPVTEVDVIDIIKWCNAKSEMEGLEPVYFTDSTFKTVYRKGHNRPTYEAIKWNATGYRLPTAAEWEFAAMGGVKTHHYLYSGSNTIGDIAWYHDNSDGKTHAVGMKAPNELGIYDMSGNVEETMIDHFFNYPPTSPLIPNHSRGFIFGSKGGGACTYDDFMCRVSFLGGTASRDQQTGFRCVKAATIE
jgi:formylglycine-generating enzyme required for sulfatase activity